MAIKLAGKILPYAVFWGILLLKGLVFTVLVSDSAILFSETIDFLALDIYFIALSDETLTMAILDSDLAILFNMADLASHPPSSSS